VACPCCGRGSHWHLLLTAARREGTHAAAWCALAADLSLHSSRPRARADSRACAPASTPRAKAAVARHATVLHARTKLRVALAPAHVRCVAARRSSLCIPL